MFFSDWYGWKLFWLFWLFGVLEIVFGFPVFFQSLKQLAGNVVAKLKYKPLPDKDNYIPQVKYSLPFEGAWVAVNGGVTKEFSHSWEIISQRYAYDFIILGDNGKSYSDSVTTLSDYYCYGNEILAPADGVVAEIRANCGDSKVIGGGKTDPLIKDIRGNYIVIKHSDGEYSCLAHLMPESIKVSVGERVKRKQAIARCGNSGNTSEPHLHFQVQSDKSFFLSAGLPICFENIEATTQLGYAQYDPRPVASSEDDVGSNFLSRGQCAKNM
jgi:Membrane proteins related to metalloendopeptidases